MLSVSTPLELISSEIINGKYNAAVLNQIKELTRDNQIEIFKLILIRVKENGKPKQLIRLVNSLVKENEWNVFLTLFTTIKLVFKEKYTPYDIKNAINNFDWGRFPIEVIESCLKIDLESDLINTYNLKQCDIVSKFSNESLISILTVTNTMFLFQQGLVRLSEEEVKETLLKRVKYPTTVFVANEIFNQLRSFNLLNSEVCLRLLSTVIPNLNPTNRSSVWGYQILWEIWNYFFQNNQVESLIRYLVSKQRVELIQEYLIGICCIHNLEYKYFPSIFSLTNITINSDEYLNKLFTAKVLFLSNIGASNAFLKNDNFEQLNDLIKVYYSDSLIERQEKFLEPIKDLLKEALISSDLTVKKHIINFLNYNNLNPNLH